MKYLTPDVPRPKIGFTKRLERWGRHALLSLLKWLFAGSTRSPSDQGHQRFLIVRLDERVGNIVMLTPLLSALRRHSPDAELTVLAGRKARHLLRNHPANVTVQPFDKKAILGPAGPLATARWLLKQEWNVCLDAGNPTDPSFTHALLTALSGATKRVGFEETSTSSVYTHTLPRPNERTSEIEMRLQLLGPLGIESSSVEDAMPTLPDAPIQEIGKEFTSWLQTLEPAFSVVNVGARLASKRLPDTLLREIALALSKQGDQVVVVWGPNERPWAEAVQAAHPSIVLAPRTNLWELFALLGRARRVATADTGPMHLAVAAGTPTCGIFVETDMNRFGYSRPPHCMIDFTGGDGQRCLTSITDWLQRDIDRCD